MTSLASLLPKPKNDVKPKVTSEEAVSDSTDASPESVLIRRDVQGQEQELQVLAGTVPKEYDEQGELRYDVLARVGHSSTRVLQTRLEDMLPSVEQREWVKPPAEEIARQTEATKAALEKILQGKIKASQATSAGKSGSGDGSAASGKDSFVRLTTKDQKQRIVRVVEAPRDPFEPPKFHHKRIPRPPPSPPAPVLHSPPRKVTKEEQESWKIPPCISNWKNAKGYTIPLDKRLAADGRGLIEHTINPNFASFAEALYVAESAAREEVEKRAAVAKRLAEQERKQTEEKLLALADQARREKARLASELRHGRETDAELAERESLRREKMKEHERDLRLSRMGPEQRAKFLARDADRDISERVALGGAAAATAAASAAASAEASLFDQRLFDQTEGITSGFGGGDDDSYNLYSKPLFGASAAAAHLIYRPTIGGHGYEEDEEAGGASGGRRAAFEGADKVAPRSGPVEFERGPEDPFGLDQLIQEAKRQKQ